MYMTHYKEIYNVTMTICHLLRMNAWLEDTCGARFVNMYLTIYGKTSYVYYIQINIYFPFFVTLILILLLYFVLEENMF